MSKNVRVVIVIIGVALVVGGITLLIHEHADNSTDTGDMSSMNMPKSNSQSSSTEQVATNSVVIENFAFSPASITVKKGTTVTWTNKDGATHTVTEVDSQTGPDSGDLASSKSYSFTYTTTGTFKYHCAIHPSMVGSVTVTN